MNHLLDLTHRLSCEEERLRKGGEERGHLRQKQLGRLFVRKRLELLLDPQSSFMELGLWAAYQMYPQWGDLPAAGVICGIGSVNGRKMMIIANDATVKAGALFPQSVKKVLRAQRIAFENRLPVIFLVDSSGVFLPLQDEIFPDEDDFGRIFRNNAIFSASGIPQYAAIMGNCIAGGGYLPVLCDTLLMTEGSGLYLAGPALVKAAIGQDVEAEVLGGAKMHAQISGTIDFREKDDPSCIQRLRSLAELLVEDKQLAKRALESQREVAWIYEIIDKADKEAQGQYDVRDVLECILDKNSLHEYKKEYGPTLVTGYAHIGGMSVGFVASQRKPVETGRGERQIGGVIYADSADKAARFIMDCNQKKIPILFFQDVVGFMVGKEAEESGIIRSGAKLVNALSNSIVPKITLIMGHSFGAGNYALCGKAYDPRFIFAWPNASYAVMGAQQAADTLFQIQKNAMGKDWNAIEAEEHKQEVKMRYKQQMDIRYGAARGWVDGIIAPHETRSVLIDAVEICYRVDFTATHFHTGVIQV